MRAPALRALGLLTGWGNGAAAVPADARRAADGRAVLSLGRPHREGERWRRATREGLLALAAVEAALDDAGAGREAIAGERTALVYVTAAAYVPSNHRFIEGRGGSIHFAETAPAVVPAEVAIELGLSGPYSIFIGGPPATLRAIAHAARLLDQGAADRALVLAVEIFEECADLYARSRRLMDAPLVEAAACLWLEPGRGELSVGPPAADEPANHGAGATIAVRRRRSEPSRARGLGETFSVEPLVYLDEWRQGSALGTLELTGRWRSEVLRLVWTEVMASGSSPQPAPSTAAASQEAT